MRDRAALLGLLLLHGIAAADAPTELDRFLLRMREHSYDGRLQESADSLQARLIAPDGSRTIGPASARIANELLRNLRLLQRWSEPGVLDLAKEVVQTLERAGAPHQAELRFALLNLAEILRTAGSPAEANAVAVRGIQLAAPPDADVEASLHGSCAWTLIDLGRLDEAEQYAQRSVELREGLPERPAEGASFGYAALGRIAEIRGRHREAAAYFERVLALRNSVAHVEPTSFALALIPLGWARYNLGEYEQSEAAYLRARELMIPLGDRGDILRAWAEANLGVLYYAQGRLDRARRVWESAYEARNRQVGPKHRWTLASQMQLALIQAVFGETEEALALAMQGVRAHEEVYGVRHHETLIALSQLAYMHGLALDPDANLESALEVARRRASAHDPPKSLLYADQVRVGLAAITARRSQVAGRALAIVDSLSADLEDPPRQELGVLAWVRSEHAASRHEPERALRAMARAESLAVSEFGEAHIRVSQCRNRLALLHWWAGSEDEGLAWAIRSSLAGARAFGWMAPGLPEAWALGYQGNSHDDSDVSLGILAGLAEPTAEQIAATWGSRAAWASIVLQALLERRRRVLDELGPDREAWLGLTRARSELAARFTYLRQNPSDPAAKAAFEAALRARRDAESVVAALSEAGGVSALGEAVDMAQIAEALPKGSALIRFERYTPSRREWPFPVGEARYAAFVVAQKEWGFVDLGDAASLDSLVADWQLEAATGELRADRSPARAWRAYELAAIALRQRLFDPLVPRLGAANEIHWVPGGALHRVNPDALLDEEGRFLIELGLRFWRISHERDLRRSRPEPSRGLLLAVGDIDYDGSAVAGVDAHRVDFSCAGSAEQRFSALPHTAAELQAIRSHWEGPVTELRGAEATQAQLERSLDHATVLHLATHAYFLADCDSIADRFEAENPLLRTGLALSGCNARATGGEDGRLSAEEVAALDLRSVDRVLLSACDTAAGIERMGEMALGLPRAFLEAGAREVVMSLWPVSDRATRELMVEYYANNGDLTAAELALLRGRRARGESLHPFGWAGFVALGVGTWTRSPGPERN